MNLKNAGKATWQEAGVKRCYKNFNKDYFLMKLMSLRWTYVYPYLDPNETLDKTMELWLGVMNRYSPLKTKFCGRAKEADKR